MQCSKARLSSYTGVPFREGQRVSPELGESWTDMRECTQALTSVLPGRPPANTAASLRRPPTQSPWSFWDGRAQTPTDAFSPVLGPLQTFSPSIGGPHIPFPTSVPSVPFALGPAPDPGNILSLPELRPLLQLPSVMGILNKCFLSQDHLISSSSPMAGIQESKAALCSLLILNLLSSISRSRERPGAWSEVLLAG